MENRNRHICHYLIDGLTAGTEYKVDVTVGSKTIQYEFQTVPLPTVTPVKVVMAGDCGNNSVSEAMLDEIATQLEPHVLMIGGDIMYDNGMHECYVVNDRFFQTLHSKLKTMGGKTNRLIPYIFAIGNHETGYKYGFDVKTAETIPPFYYLYPYHRESTLDASGVEQDVTDGVVNKPIDRRSFYLHTIGNEVALYSLDTDNAAPTSGI